MFNTIKHNITFHFVSAVTRRFNKIVCLWCKGTVTHCHFLQFAFGSVCCCRCDVMAGKSQSGHKVNGEGLQKVSKRFTFVTSLGGLFGFLHEPVRGMDVSWKLQSIRVKWANRVHNIFFYFWRWQEFVFPCNTQSKCYASKTTRSDTKGLICAIYLFPSNVVFIHAFPVPSLVSIL